MFSLPYDHDRCGLFSGIMPVLFLAVWTFTLVFMPLDQVHADKRYRQVTNLTNEDFRFGSYIIDKPGIYRLKEDIRFNPNSPGNLTRALIDGTIPSEVADAMELPNPVDAYHAGFPLFTQYTRGGVSAFSPGGPLARRYDPKAFGLGFFAAIVITADHVILDLNGHTIEQGAEHALLQRFFAVIELTSQPFISGQGPADFGNSVKASNHVVIKNGTIGRSAHHGIHGNGNRHIRIKNINFVDYEVAAVALNGVKDLVVKNVHASNREDVPVLGTFSSAQFIKLYVEDLARRNATTELVVNGLSYDVEDIRSALMDAVNNVHEDIIVSPNWVDGRPQIDPDAHQDEHALFHNPFGVIDGNSYSFLVNAMGVAVDGFPTYPDEPAKHIFFSNVHVHGQRAFINEIVALGQNGKVVTDPVGAVFQIRNVDHDSGEPITISSLSEEDAYYVGNVVANAQAFVAKAYLNGEFADSRMDISRLSITEEILKWVEGQDDYETLDRVIQPEQDYYCNGDSMFHVNKGVIAFKMDAAQHVRLENTSVNNVVNLGYAGSMMCGDYGGTLSHPKATLYGYGGATTRGYSFAGSHHVILKNSHVSGLTARYGSAIGVDIFTDARRVNVRRVNMWDITAGRYDPSVVYDGPNHLPQAIGFHIGDAAKGVKLKNICAEYLGGIGGEAIVDDESAVGRVRKVCR